MKRILVAALVSAAGAVAGCQVIPRIRVINAVGADGLLHVPLGGGGARLSVGAEGGALLL